MIKKIMIHILLHSKTMLKKAGKISIVFLISIITIHTTAKQVVGKHNCRFFGFVFDGELNNEWKERIQTHLDSLQALGTINVDGWGIGYYVSPQNNEMLPVVSRGEPKASEDPRYTATVEEMLHSFTNGCIAHVRLGSSGPTEGIPNPHPFRRRAINKTFDMLFAHNGTINTSILLSLIDSTYLKENPPDYNPDYLDSDLYSIYIMNIIDKYPTYSIHQCIVIAITNLASQLPGIAELNFVMTDGSTIWALRYADTNINYYTVYYFPMEFTSEKWVVASQPLDDNPFSWTLIPNYSLITLVPGETPDIYYFKEENQSEKIYKSLEFQSQYPNPVGYNFTIRYISPDTRRVNITLYDETGRLIKCVFRGKSNIGKNQISCNFPELSNGVYFIRLETEEIDITRKVVFMH
jgi:predicted glutamine amidotransferase